MQDATRAGLLRGWMMIPITVAWIGIFAVTVVFLAVGLPARHNQVSIPCLEQNAPTGSPCAFYQLSETGQRVLLDLGLSLDIYAWFLTVLIIVIAPIFLLLAFIILFRSRGQLVTLCLAFALLLFVPGYFASITEAIIQDHPDWLRRIDLFKVMAIWVGILYGLIFPSGTFYPRWTRPLMLVATAIAVMLAVFPTVRLLPSSNAGVTYWLSIATFSLFAITLWAQISRYRHFSTVSEREQTKWVVFGFSILVLEMVMFGMAPVLFPELHEPGRLEVLYTVGNALASATAAVVLAVSFAVAILHHRLFDIDVIINRTLVYGALSVSLAIVYVSGVLLGEFLLRSMTPDSDLAIVFSTLAVAALFNPVRRRIQNNVDRLFFRRKYDAARTIAAFSMMVRDEVDLERLDADLMSAVDETLQPSHAYLWLRKQ